MKVGDLVKVHLTHGREPISGLVVEVKKDECNCIALVQTLTTLSHGNRLMYANHEDVEVINENR